MILVTEVRMGKTETPPLTSRDGTIAKGDHVEAVRSVWTRSSREALCQKGDILEVVCLPSCDWDYSVRHLLGNDPDFGVMSSEVKKVAKRPPMQWTLENRIKMFGPIPGDLEVYDESGQCVGCGKMWPGHKRGCHGITHTIPLLVEKPADADELDEIDAPERLLPLLEWAAVNPVLLYESARSMCIKMGDLSVDIKELVGAQRRFKQMEVSAFLSVFHPEMSDEKAHQLAMGCG